MVATAKQKTKLALEGLKVSPEMRKYVESLLESDPFEQVLAAQEIVAEQNLNALAKTYAEEEAERRRVWGNRYPFRYGEVPEKSKSKKTEEKVVESQVSESKNAQKRPRTR